MMALETNVVNRSKVHTLWIWCKPENTYMLSENTNMLLKNIDFW